MANKVAIVILADTETSEALGRVANALGTVQEFKDAGDDIQLIFDGAGTKWPGQLSDPSHKYHSVFKAVKDKVAGVCEYCANAFDVTDEIKQANLPIAGDYQGHPSFRQLVSDGYQIITF